VITDHYFATLCLLKRSSKGLPEERSRVAAPLIRAYTGMSSLMGMRLMQAEAEACIDLLTPNQSSRVLRLGLCFMLSSPGLSKLVTRVISHRFPLAL
jgi:hypothetical protein